MFRAAICISIRPTRVPFSGFRLRTSGAAQLAGTRRGIIFNNHWVRETRPEFHRVGMPRVKLEFTLELAALASHARHGLPELWQFPASWLFENGPDCPRVSTLDFERDS